MKCKPKYRIPEQKYTRRWIDCQLQNNQVDNKKEHLYNNQRKNGIENEKSDVNRILHRKECER